MRKKILFYFVFVFNMFLNLLLVEEKTINLKASQILIVAVSSHLKETNISHSLLHSGQQDKLTTLGQLRLADHVMSANSCNL